MHLIPTIQMLSLNRVHSIKPLSTTANNCLIWDRNNVGSRATAGIKRWPCKEVTDDWSEVVSRAQVTIKGTNSRKWWRLSLAIWWKESVVWWFGNAWQNKWSPPCIKIVNTVIPIHFLIQVSCRRGISQVSWTMLTFPVSQKTWIPRGKIKMVVNLLRKLSMSILWNTWGNQWKNYWGITPAEGYFHYIQGFSGLWCSKGYTPSS